MTLISKLMKYSVAIAACAVVQASCWAAKVDKPMFPDSGSWGLVIHSPYKEAIKDIGVQWVRIGLRWNYVESTTQGVYDWTDADKLVNFYVDNGFKVMLILGLEDLPKVYESDKDKKDVVIDAIGRWAGAAAERYKGKRFLWEISNEPEVFPMGGYWNNPVTYTEMARRVAKAVKAADPSSKIGAESVAWMDRPFITKSLEAGLLSDATIDVITFHGYHRVGITPESGLTEDMIWLRGMIAKHAPKGHKVIAVDSERGYMIRPLNSPKDQDMWRNVVYCESEQAAYLARHYLEEIYLGIEISVWYKDMWGEEQFSLYYGDDKSPEGLRPMGVAYKNLSALLPDNPLKMVNNAFQVTTVAANASEALPVTVFTRSYLRTLKDKRQLIIALWNAVEAFDGKILATREHVGRNIIESWRDVVPSDKIETSVKVSIKGKEVNKITKRVSCDILAKDPANVYKSITTTSKSRSEIETQTLNLGPTPTVLVFDLPK